MDDWQRIRDVIAARWESTFYLDDHPMPLPSSMREVFERMESEEEVYTGWWCIQGPEGLGIRSIINYPEEVRFDLGPDEIAGQPQLEALCEFVRAIGATLDRSVFVCHEHGSTDEAMALDTATMRYVPETDAVVRVPPPDSTPKSLFERWDENAAARSERG